jgi:cytoskeletal protein RodZ
MNIRTSGRAAFVIATGLWICTSVPLHATENDTPAAEPTATVGSAADTSAEPTKATKHRSARNTEAKSRKADRQASKASKKSAEDDTAKADDAKPEGNNAAMPPSVANANAQWPSETAATNTYNMTSQAGSVLGQIGGQQEQPATATPDSSASNAQVVAADQLNDLDRAISDEKPPLTLAKATIDAPAAEVASGGSTTWDTTSLVGKIFIAFGGLLTMASAARMFMA